MNTTKLLFAATAVALSAGVANAATYYATTIESYNQGGCTRPAECVADRYNPINALGAPDGQYVSLGMGGDLTVGFGTTFTGTAGETRVKAWEVTYSANDPSNTHLEAVDVYAVLDGVETLLGRLTNEYDAASNSLLANVPFQFIRLVDATVAQFGTRTTSFDGFDVDSVSVAAIPLPATGLMLLGGLGGFAAVRRRNKAKAA